MSVAESLSRSDIVKSEIASNANEKHILEDAVGYSTEQQSKAALKVSVSSVRNCLMKAEVAPCIMAPLADCRAIGFGILRFSESTERLSPLCDPVEGFALRFVWDAL
jgi:hypothetical protein